MTLDYKSTSQTSITTHDRVYTTLLAVLAFLTVLEIGVLVRVATRATSTAERADRAQFSAFLQGCYLVAIVVVLVIRLASPMKRRWPTLALNLVLLIDLPFDTLL